MRTPASPIEYSATRHSSELLAGGAFGLGPSDARVTHLRTLGPDSDALDFSELQSHLGGGAGVLAARLLLSDPQRTDENPDAPDLEKLRKPLLQLKIRRLEERGVELQPMIAAAEARGDRDGRTALLAEKQKLSEEVRRMKQELRRPAAGPG